MVSENSLTRGGFGHRKPVICGTSAVLRDNPEAKMPMKNAMAAIAAMPAIKRYGVRSCCIVDIISDVAGSHPKGAVSPC